MFNIIIYLNQSIKRMDVGSQQENTKLPFNSQRNSKFLCNVFMLNLFLKSLYRYYARKL